MPKTPFFKITDRTLTYLYGATILLSASLLFMVQPLFAKMLLPALGGASAVWVTLMFVYQGLLLLGYGYAHGLSHWLPQRWQIPLHLVLVALSFYWLPIASRAVLEAPATAMPLDWLILTALAGIGAPFFMLSATSPLLQHWFAHLPHKRSANPYFLYAVSNIGSLGALLAYPFLFERFLALGWQQGSWFWAYVVFTLLLLACGVLARDNWQQKAVSKQTDPLRSETIREAWAPVKLTTTLHWLTLSLVPSSLLLGVTTYITTQITSLPLLWVVPLALYLLTFVIAFSEKPLISPRQSVVSAAVGFAGILLLTAADYGFTSLSLMWHLLSFFFVAQALHHILAGKKPAAEKLTGFYFVMSLGGVLGGSVNAVVAPLVFSSVYEYPLMLLAAALLLAPHQKRLFQEVYQSRRLAKGLAWGLDALLPLALFALLWLPGKKIVLAGYAVTFAPFISLPLTMFLTLLVVFLSLQRPFRLGFAAALVLGGMVALHNYSADHIMTKRSFYGTYSILFNEERLAYDLISQGTSARQGSQSIDPEEALRTDFFYNFAGLREHLPEELFKKPWASAGLGVGTVACLSPYENKVTFIEIDPLVVALAQDSGYFTYLKNCPGENPVMVGDGRRMITEKFAKNSLGMIFLDTFSGASIPTHMLTKEAFRTYLEKLTPDGILAINVTNLHFDLVPLVARQAADLGLVGLYVTPTERHKSTWVVLARKAAHLGTLEADPDWRPLPPAPENLRGWTDSFATLLPLL